MSDMTTSDRKALLSLPTVTLAIISIICCIYVCIAIIKNGFRPLQCCLSPCKIRCKLCNCICRCTICKRYNKQYYQLSSSETPATKPIPQTGNMIDIIFWMCITDIFWNIFIVLNWAPLTIESFGFDIPFWDGIECICLGIYAQIFILQSPLWHLLLAYNLGFLLLRGTLNSLKKLHQQRYYQYMFVIVTPFFFVVLPIFFTKYGVYANNNSFDKECWLVAEPWQLISVCLVLLSLFFHYIILLLLCCKYYRFRNYGQRNITNCNMAILQYKSVISRLSRFVFVYTIIRILPAIERIWECFTIGPPPFWLIVGHHLCISIIGVANFIAWNINQMDPNTTYSSKGTVEQEAEDLLSEWDQNSLCLNSKNTVTGPLNSNNDRKNMISTPDAYGILDAYNLTTPNSTNTHTITTTTATSRLDSKFIWKSQRTVQ